MHGNLIVERSNGVGTVTLDRPEIRNAFDEALIAALAKALKALDADRAVRVVVLAGSGQVFCAGADLNWMKRMSKYTRAQNLADARALAEMLRTLDRLSKPTIARVHGHVYAGGMGLVAACDMAIGVPEAQFCLSEARLGLSPATISPYVVRAMGERAARRYFLTAERFSAAEALRIGLLSELVAPQELDARISDLCTHVIEGGPQAVAKIKDLVAAVSRGGPPSKALIDDTARRIAEIRTSKEGREGIASFLDRRKPSWLAGAGASAPAKRKR